MIVEVENGDKRNMWFLLSSAAVLADFISIRVLASYQKNCSLQRASASDDFMLINGILKSLAQICRFAEVSLLVGCFNKVGSEEL